MTSCSFCCLFFSPFISLFTYSAYYLFFYFIYVSLFIIMCREGNRALIIIAYFSPLLLHQYLIYSFICPRFGYYRMSFFYLLMHSLLGECPLISVYPFPSSILLFPLFHSPSLLINFTPLAIFLFTLSYSSIIFCYVERTGE